MTAEFYPEIDPQQAISDALEIILNNRSNDPEQMRYAHGIVRAEFQRNREALPYPLYNIGRRLIEHAIRDVMEEGGYQHLFTQFADDPYMLAKILVGRDPDRFFDFLLVAWNLRKMLPEYVEVDPDDLPASRGGGSGGGPDGEPGEFPRTPPENLLQRIRENIEHLDEENIFEMAIPLFRQRANKEKDGFQKGYEDLLHLLDGVTNPESVARIERVFDRFSELIDMDFGQFRPHLKRKNFPYITVRNAIKKMEEAQENENGSRRFAYFDTRTGKTSLALLEAEYLGKERALYICPPDTIATIINEYGVYGGSLSRIHVASSANDIRLFAENSGEIRYCIIPSSLIGFTESSDRNGDSTGDEIDDVDNLADEIEEGVDNVQSSDDSDLNIESLREHVNPATLQLFENWQPDYVAVDEARHFTGYHCRSNAASSRKSRALLYLLNNRVALENNMTVRLMDATPGDLPRHFYPLLSILNPARFPMPEDVRDTVGSQPYLLSSFFAEKTDHATHNQVYNRPPVRIIGNRESRVEMGAAQNAIYDYAARYSTRDVLHRITLARISTFNPVVLRPAFRRLLESPMPEDMFTSYFDDVYGEWIVRSEEQDVAFDWDFIARFGNRDLLMNLFAFGPGEFETCYQDNHEKLNTLRQLNNSTENLSCKAQHVIDRLREIVNKSNSEERHPRRIIIYSSFKRGLTRDLDLGDNDVPLELERILNDQIRQAVPEVNTYMLDGGVSTKSRRDGLSARDAVRRAWRDDEGISVLLAVSPATCQGIDLTSPGNMIEEIHMDTPLDSRLDYQVQSRTLGPNQNRTIFKQMLQAVTTGGRDNTIDAGIRDLVVSKYLFRDLVCRGVSVPSAFLESIENRRTFLGGFCDTEKDEEEITNGIRENMRNALDNNS